MILHRRILLGVCVLALTLSSAARAVELTGWFWADKSFHISTGDLTATGVGGNDWEAAFRTAVSRWNNAEVPFTVTEDGNTQLESCDFNDPNTTYFSADACGSAWQQNVVGLSVTWANVHDGEASQTSILFNSAETWGVYDGAPTATVEFTRVAVHEIGHSIGLGHTTTVGAIMEPVGSATILPQNDDRAGVQRIYNLDDVVLLPDVNSSNFQEIAPLRLRVPARTGRVQVRESNNGSLIQSFSYFSGYTPVAMFMSADRNSNGVPELTAVHRRNSDGRTLLERRDPTTGANVGNTWFSPANAPVFGGESDIDNNGTPESIVVLVRDSDGAVAAQIRNDAGALVRNVYFSPGFSPADFKIVPDMNGNGTPEVMALLIRVSDARALVQIRDTSNGLPVSSIWQPTGYDAFNITVVSDTNNNGFDDVATLVQKTSDGAIGVRIADGNTGTQLRTIWYRPGGQPGSSVFAKNAIATLPDVSGNGVDEVAILVQTNDTQRTVLATRDAFTGAQVTNIFVSPDFDAERLVVLNSVNGNNSSELGVYGFSGAYQPQVILYDPMTLARLNTVYYPNQVD